MQEWKAAGIEVPALANRPALMPHELFALECYLRLSGSRRPSMGAVPMPVPISEAAAAYSFLNLAQHWAREEWLSLVSDLDDALIAFRRAEYERDNAKAKK